MTKSQRYLEAHEQILGMVTALPPGAQLPSESALAEQLAFSRNTIRDALTKLERDGTVIRRHGLGTFVAPRLVRLQTPINTVTPIHELIRAAGFEPRVRDLKLEWQSGETQACQALGVPTGTALLTVSLLHLASTQPAVSIRYQLAPSLEPERLDFTEFDGQMIRLLEQERGLRVHQTRASIRAVSATPALAAQLRIEVGAALLEFRSVAFSTTGQALYHSLSHQDSRLLEVNVVRHRE